MINGSSGAAVLFNADAVVDNCRDGPGANPWHPVRPVNHSKHSRFTSCRPHRLDGIATMVVITTGSDLFLLLFLLLCVCVVCHRVCFGTPGGVMPSFDGLRNLHVEDDDIHPFDGNGLTVETAHYRNFWALHLHVHKGRRPERKFKVPQLALQVIVSKQPQVPSL